MIEKQPYEKHLAEGLEQLPPVGDPVRHWPDLKARLDRELPEGGVFFRWQRWGKWGGLLLLLLVFVSVVWYFSDNKQTDASIHMDQTTREGASPSITSKVTDKAVVSTNPNTSTADPENKIADPAPPAAIDKREKIVEAKAITSNTPLSNARVVEEASAIKRKEAPVVSGKKNATIKTISKDPVLASRQKVVSDAGSYYEKARVLNHRKKSGGKKSDPAAGGRGEELHSVLYDQEEALAFRPAIIRMNKFHSFISLNTGLLLTDSLSAQYSAAIHHKMIPVPKRSRFKEVTERTQKLHNREVGRGEQQKFVFGLALPLAFPISDQKAVAYNFNGGQNTVSDYLPTPHVQYHLGKESFLQAEVQLINPQFIRPALLSQLTREQSAPGNNRYVTTSIFAKKLYYFNLPVSVYYSPFKNFYLGTGLQFSSLLGGIAYSEYRAGNSIMPMRTDTLLRYSYSKFRNDSLSGRLNSSEFRVLLDAQYYWKRFAVGMRYNQGLGNYINLQVSPNMPNVIDRNRALQFYLRYNLWEKL